jgi:hypothetical protein
MFRSLQPIIAALALAAMVAACTGTAGGPGVATLDDPSASSAPTPSPSAVTPQDAALAFARCMRENGVDMPDPIVETDGGGGISIGQAGPDSTVSKDAFREADEICRHFMEAAMPEAGPPLSAEDMDKMLAFAQCMREHGIDMEDPTADGGIRVQIGSGSSSAGGTGGAPVPINEPELEAAHAACNSLLPGRMGEKMNNVGGGPDEAPKNVGTDPAGSN